MTVDPVIWATIGVNRNNSTVAPPIQTERLVPPVMAGGTTQMPRGQLGSDSACECHGEPAVTHRSGEDGGAVACGIRGLPGDRYRGTTRGRQTGDREGSHGKSSIGRLNRQADLPL